MFKFIDNALDRITMYRLVLYCLLVIILCALLFSGLGWLPFHPSALLFSTVVLVLICRLVNTACAAIWHIPTNKESVYITALILALIISPPSFYTPLVTTLTLLLWVAVWAMLSKYLVNIQGKHVFNPAAVAVTMTALTLNQSASWWVGSSPLFVVVLMSGLLVVRKVRRFDAVLSFAVTTVLTTLAFAALGGQTLNSLTILIFSSPFIFFATIMLTEPLTMPPSRRLRLWYGGIVGFLFTPILHVGAWYLTPEIALLIGNIFSYVVSPKGRYILQLKEKKMIGATIENFTFSVNRPLHFLPGQYLEWTLNHYQADNRGNRRYFTIASSPTENDIQLGVKRQQPASSFKRQLTALVPGQKIMAGQLAGDFVLPKDKNKKMVFIAGGIGITPFRSMIKYLLDRNEFRSMVLFYSNTSADEIVYDDIFNEAQKIGLKTVHTLTGSLVPVNWAGYHGYLTTDMITREVPDYSERIFYISGSHTMVTTFQKTLRALGVPRRHIKVDFFPGLA